MKPKIAVILNDCIEHGVARGWERAHKHNSAPTEDQVKTYIEECVMGEIYEYFSFEENEVWFAGIAPAKTQESPPLIIMKSTQRGTADA